MGLSFLASFCVCTERLQRCATARRERRRWIIAMEPSARAIAAKDTSVVTVPSA
jgi:hypothetical protein